MRRIYFLGAASALLFALSAPAQTPPPAQPKTPTGGQPKTGTPTTGGKAPAGSPTTGGTANNSPFGTPLYQMNDVSRSLKLQDAQNTRLTELGQRLEDRYQRDAQGLDRLNERERATRANELQSQYRADWLKGAQGIFDERQLSRYQQLQYQYGGFNSLSDADVQRRLNLTAEQQAQLKASLEWNSTQLQGIDRAATSDREKASQLYTDYWKARGDRFNKFLTADQQKAWAQLTGDPFAFPSPYSAPPVRK